MINTFEVPYFGLVPETWKTSRFKYLFNLGKGLSITKADLVDEGIPVISYGQIHSKSNTGTHLSADLLRSIPESMTRRTSLLKEEDIVFADTSEDYIGIGNAAYVDCPSPVYAGYHTIWARCKAHYIYPKYYAYLFLTDEWRNQIRINSFGVKVFSVTQKLLSSSFVLLPPLQIQKEIVAYLDTKCLKLDSLSSDIQKEIETLEAYKKSLITETVTKGLDKSALMKDSGIDWIGIVSEKWSTIKIRFVTTIRTEKIEYKEEGGHYLGLENIEGFSGKFIPSETIYPAGIYDKYNKNDLLFSLLRPYLGKVMLANDFGACSGELVVIKSFSGYMPYLFYCMISNRFIETVNLSTYGAKMPRASWDFVRNMFIPVPPFQEQKAIAAFLDSKCSEIDSIIASKKKQLDTLASYKKSLIYEYVTGKKEVK